MMSLMRGISGSSTQVRRGAAGVYSAADMLPAFARDIVRVVRNTAECSTGPSGVGGVAGSKDRERRTGDFTGFGMSSVVSRVWKSDGTYAKLT